MKIKSGLIVIAFFAFNILFAQDTLSVLFLGNSYTSVNNLPLLVQNLSASAGKTLIIDSNLPGGMTLSGHINDATTMTKIQQSNWDYVIIQEQSQIPTIDYYRYNDMYPSLTDLKNMIEFYNPCAKIITYMTWGRRFGGIQCDPSNTYCSPNFVDFNHMQDSLTSAYLQISDALNVQCAPVGVVWKNILNDTTLVLHSGDNSHPNLDGSYVAACAIFSSIWKQAALGLTYTAGISNSSAQYYQSISDNTIFNSTNDWNLNINNPIAEFNESVSGNTVTFTNLSTSMSNTLDYFWDFGDGSTSNAQNPVHPYATTGTYTVTLIVSNCIFSDAITKTLQIGPLSVTENLFSQLKIWPNPAISHINIETEYSFSDLYYTINDVEGRMVLEGKIESENSKIDISNLSKGIYLVNIKGFENTSFKFIKE
ncbi:MAG: T9SS type A sorting domain-containing protein [Flavobacteriales bacterium]|nr:T9SS type A sorting domain-containing protein [Flavobacteriales bacterium]